VLVHGSPNGNVAQGGEWSRQRWRVRWWL
jgi:hypothetical protein